MKAWNSLQNTLKGEEETPCECIIKLEATGVQYRFGDVNKTEKCPKSYIFLIGVFCCPKPDESSVLNRSFVSLHKNF